MQQVQFDSFGERLPGGDAQTPGTPPADSRWVRHTIVGFWLLVVAVVAARVFLAVSA